MKRYFFILCFIHTALMPTVFAEQISTDAVEQTAPQVNNKASIYYFDADWKHITTPVANGFYRKILKTTPENWFVAQDFYQSSNKKQTEPFILQNESDLVEGSPNSIHGPLILWYEDGKKDLETNYINGKEQGLLQKWYDNGLKEAEQTYIDGKLEGLMTIWDSKGNKTTEANYKNNLLNGQVKLWDNNKQLAEYNYIEGTQEGVNINWNKQDYKHVTQYKNGKPSGLYTVYYPNGNKQREFTYNKDSKQDLSKFWYLNGQMMSEIISDQCKIWDEEGSIIYQGNNTERCVLTIRNILDNDN